MNLLFLWRRCRYWFLFAFEMLNKLVTIKIDWTKVYVIYFDLCEIGVLKSFHHFVWFTFKQTIYVNSEHSEEKSKQLYSGIYQPNEVEITQHTQN